VTQQRDVFNERMKQEFVTQLTQKISLCVESES
jgi:hypothetical protein